ncbi:hypothetical protein Ahy_A02g009317 [Arachis hypogaea]|uniref:Uncharacterized protein n=1 Tax=Arachis hypogaea TaxID=3818 RepID=A0A445EGQ1_ARAHY|nr:hypothetical protein Ahy_A02g009317 [Arachis hypogaea]
MKHYSTNSHEWMERGMKLYNQNNYSMATMCFERAGDDYWLKKCKNAALNAIEFEILFVGTHITL